MMNKKKKQAARFNKAEAKRSEMYCANASEMMYAINHATAIVPPQFPAGAGMSSQST